MKKYVIYIDGLNLEKTVSALSEKAAYQKVWNSLNSDQQDTVCVMDCLDEIDNEEELA